MSKAGLGGLEVLLSSLFPAVGRSLTSGLWAYKGWVPVILLAFFFLLLASASFLLHYFHILRLVSSPWRVGLIAAAATCSA